MHLQDIHILAERGLRLWSITDDPLTFSAATTLLKSKSSQLTEPEQNCLDLLQKQLEAYKVIFPFPM